ncbi:MAG: hypothetical protein IJM44_00180 [Ruminococcus sp.]|nr:hypothetical protein [Ruminococcus sp.]
MKMNKFIAAVAASALSVSAFAAMSATNASAAQTEIAYTQSDNSLNLANDGKMIRRNIYNVWTTPQIKDIDGANTTVEEMITVDFTVSGINDGDEANIWLAGSIGGVSVWDLDEAADAIKINGNGDYTVSWTGVNSANIDCLILESDINCYNYGSFTGLDGSGVSLTIKSIKTGKEDETTTSTTTTTSGAAADNNSTTTTTKAAEGGATTTTGVKSAATGDHGVAVAVSFMTLAGVAAYVARKKD